jgi:hypothetical protein
MESDSRKPELAVRSTVLLDGIVMALFPFQLLDKLHEQIDLLASALLAQTLKHENDYQNSAIQNEKLRALESGDYPIQNSA